MFFQKFIKLKLLDTENKYPYFLNEVKKNPYIFFNLKIDLKSLKIHKYYESGFLV